MDAFVKPLLNAELVYGPVEMSFHFMDGFNSIHEIYKYNELSSSLLFVHPCILQLVFWMPLRETNTYKKIYFRTKYLSKI